MNYFATIIILVTCLLWSAIAEDTWFGENRRKGIASMLAIALLIWITPEGSPARDLAIALESAIVSAFIFAAILMAYCLANMGNQFNLKESNIRVTILAGLAAIVIAAAAFYVASLQGLMGAAFGMGVLLVLFMLSYKAENRS